MRVRYDEQADALYIRLKENKYYESDEIREGVIVDYDKDANVIGIEILDASAYLLPREIATMTFDINRVLPKSKIAQAKI